MHLVQLFLPRTDGRGAELPRQLFAQVRAVLLERFGGMTAYVRTPAKGLWVDDSSVVVDDDLIVYEVVVEQLDRDWWRPYLAGLEKDFRQERLHVRVVQMDLL